MSKYYYENVLATENIPAKTNVTWVADITSFDPTVSQFERSSRL